MWQWWTDVIGVVAIHYSTVSPHTTMYINSHTQRRKEEIECISSLHQPSLPRACTALCYELTVQFIIIFCIPSVVSRENTGIPLHKALQYSGERRRRREKEGRGRRENDKQRGVPLQFCSTCYLCCEVQSSSCRRTYSMVIPSCCSTHAE